MLFYSKLKRVIMTPKRETDPEDLPVEKLRQTSVSKDWLIGVLVLALSALMTVGMRNLDAQQARTVSLVDNHSVRIERLEENRGEIFRRLDSIESKLDKILGWNKSVQ